jgi:glycosyltransferase involved in cell wall biosynthesis
MKDHATFLEAAAHLVASGSTAHFICAGSGVDSRNAALMDTISRRGLEDRVHLLGEEPDPAGLLPGLDLLCSSSAWGEGFPNVVGEAMACGVPCVVTEVGDSARLVDSTGRVVPPRDPMRLAEGMSALLSEGEDARTARSLLARQRIVQAYSLSATAARYAELLRDVSRNSGEHRPATKGPR